MHSVYRYLRALSLDVVAGALISNMFLAHILDARLPVSALIALGLTVWIIYTVDHLWDAARIKGPAATFRHRFHQQNFKLLQILAMLALLVLAGVCFFLPLEVLRLGLVVGSFVIIYFVLIRTAKIAFFKELTIAVIYTLGIFLAPMALAGEVQWFVLILFAEFVLLAMANLLEFSYFEMDSDQKHQFDSAALKLGSYKTAHIIKYCLLLTCLLSVTTFIMGSGDHTVRTSQLVVVIMAMLLAVIIWAPGYFRNNERFRMVGDAVFLLPLISLWL